MTENIFEIETTALVHVACAPQESGILLTDFAAAYPSVNHSWIFSVLENTGLLGFLCHILRSTSQRQHHARGIRESRPRNCSYVRQGCPASGLQWASTRFSDGCEFLQPAQFAYADFLDVASESLLKV